MSARRLLSLVQKLATQSPVSVNMSDHKTEMIQDVDMKPLEGNFMLIGVN